MDNLININKKLIRENNEILSNSIIFTPNKYLFFLILKGDEESNIPQVFYEEKSDIEYDQYYDNNDLIAKECEDIILAEEGKKTFLVTAVALSL